MRRIMATNPAIPAAPVPITHNSNSTITKKGGWSAAAIMACILPRFVRQVSIRDHLDEDTSQFVVTAFLEGLDYNSLTHVVRSLDKGRPICKFLELLEIERHDSEIGHTKVGCQSRPERLSIHPLSTIQDVKCTEP